MNAEKMKHIFYAVGIFIILSSLCLWSWNTLAELFGGPHAQYKHVVAAIVLGLMIRWIIKGGSHLRKTYSLFGPKPTEE